MDPRLVEGRVLTKPGKVEWHVLEGDLARLYELGDYETVDFHILTEGDRKILLLGGAPKPPAPTRLRFGLKLDTDFASNSSFGLRLGAYFTRLNALRGEVRTKVEVGRINSVLLEFYQPTGFGGQFFVSPSVWFTRSPYDLYVNDANVARLRKDEFGGVLDVGVALRPLRRNPPRSAARADELQDRDLHGAAAGGHGADRGPAPEGGLRPGRQRDVPAARLVRPGASSSRRSTAPAATRGTGSSRRAASGRRASATSRSRPTPGRTSGSGRTSGPSATRPRSAASCASRASRPASSTRTTPSSRASSPTSAS